MNETLFAERMAALRAKVADTNPAVTDLPAATTVPHTLTTFLILYHKAQHECFINYNKGTIALLRYLTYDNKVPLNLELDKYLQTLNPACKYPKLLDSYESTSLTMIIVDYITKAQRGDIQTALAEVTVVKKAVLYTTLDLINRGLI